MRLLTRDLSALFAVAALCAACGGTADSPADTTAGRTAAGGDTTCAPRETRAANAPDQQPAFPGQTRACAITSDVVLDVAVLTQGLVHPWAVEPLPGGDLLVTERPGRMRVVTAAGQLGEPLTGIPAVAAAGQGGLLDVALSPQFATDRTIFWSYSEPRPGGNATAVARGVLAEDRRSVGQVQVILRTLPVYDGDKHFGSRLAFGPDGMLYVTIGERSDAPMRVHAQRLDGHLGKVLRINPDGTAPGDNPLSGEANARAEVFSYGHRNPQAAAFDGEGRLWVVDHGPRGGDELNLVEAGKNYGWAEVTYGIEYSGSPIPNAVTARDGTEQPVYYWDPVIAPSGAQWYSGDLFPAWRGNLLVGALVDNALVRLRVEDGRVTGEEFLLTDRAQRVRDVRQGPDGALYIVTDEEAGELWRVTPRQ